MKIRFREGEIVNPTLAVDFSANAAYLRLSDNKIAETREIVPGVLVDLDEMQVAVSLEILGLGIDIPRTQLVTEYRMRSEDLDLLDSIRPNVTQFVQHQSTPHATPSPLGEFA